MFCNQCGFNFADDQASCPSCQTPAARTNPWVEAFPSQGAALPSNPWASLGTPEAPPPAPPAPPAPLPPLPPLPTPGAEPPVVSGPSPVGGTPTPAPAAAPIPPTPVWDDQIPAFDTQEGLARFEEVYGGAAPSLSTPATPVEPPVPQTPSQVPGAFDQFFTPQVPPAPVPQVSTPPATLPPMAPPVPTSPPPMAPGIPSTPGSVFMEGTPVATGYPPAAVVPPVIPPIPEGYGVTAAGPPVQPPMQPPVPSQPSMIDQLIAESATPGVAAPWSPPGQPLPGQPSPTPAPPVGTPSVLDQIIAETGSQTPVLNAAGVVVGTPSISGPSTSEEPSLLEQMLGVSPTGEIDASGSPGVTTSSETPRLDALVGGELPPGAPLPDGMAYPPNIPGVTPAPGVGAIPTTMSALDATAAMPVPQFDERVQNPPQQAPISLPDSFFRTEAQAGPALDPGYLPAPDAAVSGMMGAEPQTPAPRGMMTPPSHLPTEVIASEELGDLVPSSDQDPSSVIVEGRTPVELASNTVKRDRTTLRIVLLIVTGLILVATVSALLIWVL